MGGTSYLARSEEDMVKLEVALNNRDSSSIKTMLSENRIFEIRSATEVQVLEVMDGYARVRVMSGDQAKESGWTFKDWVRPRKISLLSSPWASLSPSSSYRPA